MNQPNPMRTLSEVLEKLRKRGISKDILMNEQQEFVLRDGSKKYRPEDLIIRRSYRFEGEDSNPDDNAVLYVVEDTSGELVIIIDSYGVDSNYDGSAFDEFIKNIRIDETENFSLD